METHNSITDSLWVEKYRSKNLDDLILPENYRKKFQEYIDNKNIPNLLFVGPAGSGKTSLARILTSKQGILSHPSSNLLEANGSSQYTRGIGFVEKVIEPFLKTMPFGDDKLRVVFIDECDYLTDESFASQRGIIEKYESTGRFIYTANYISKIPEPVKSRLQVFTFNKIPINFVTDYCKKILKSENVEYKKEYLNFVIKELYPDVRKIVNILQKNNIDGKIILSKDSTLTDEKKLTNNVVEIISAIKRKESGRINKLISGIVSSLNETDLDFRNVYSSLFYNKNVPVPAKIIVNKYTNSHGNCLVPSMHFCAMVFEICKCLSKG